MEKGTDRQTSYFLTKDKNGIELKDLDTKLGIVTGYIAVFNIKDSDGDIILPGAFKRSLQHNGPGTTSNRIAHLLNHSSLTPVGKFQVLKEDDYGLYFESKISKSTLGKDTLIMYDEGIYKEHSFGYAVEDNGWSEDRQANLLKQLFLFEGSTLVWGANEFTHVTGIKSVHSEDGLKKTIDSYSKILRKGSLSDETCYLLELQLKQMQQAINDLKNNSLSGKPDPVQENHSEQGNSNSKVDVNLLIQSFNKSFN